MNKLLNELLFIKKKSFFSHSKKKISEHTKPIYSNFGTTIWNWLSFKLRLTQKFRVYLMVRWLTAVATILKMRKPKKLATFT